MKTLSLVGEPGSTAGAPVSLAGARTAGEPGSTVGAPVSLAGARTAGELEITVVPVEHVPRVVGGLSSFLDIAAARSTGRTSAADILRMILTGQYLLWVLFNKGTMKMHGMFVTEIVNYPQRRMLVAQHVVVEDHLMSAVEGRVETLACAYAKDIGCHGIEFVGRPGWRRYAKDNGYIMRAVVYEKMFEAKESK